MANEVLLDKFYTSAAYEDSDGAAAFQAQLANKFYASAAYEDSDGAVAFKAAVFHKAYVLAAYRYQEAVPEPSGRRRVTNINVF